MKDNTTKLTGILVFILGIAILTIVFFIVCKIFLMDNTVTAAIHDTSKPLAENLINWAAKALVKLIMLIFMTAAGSIITDRGIKFYFASSDDTKKK